MSKKITKEQVEYENRLRRRLKILLEQFKNGKIKIAEGLEVKNSLLAVRTGPDGEVNLDTVDGLVRSMALVVTAMHDREEIKNSVSLSDIQNSYFNFIEQSFGQSYKTMIEHGLTPHDFAETLIHSPESVQEIIENLDEFLKIIDEFWNNFGNVAHIHIEDMHGNIKGIFGGDLFPAHDENIASKCGIYTDTLILPDPFLRSKHIFDLYSIEDKVFYLVKHALNILQYKDLACADIAIPIVAILPNSSGSQIDEQNYYLKLGKEDSLVHNEKLFGRKFESIEELLEFSTALDTVERVIAEIDDAERVLLGTDCDGDLESQLNQALESDHYKNVGLDSPGKLLALHSVGRMSISNELLIKSRRLNGTPIIDAPTSWQYLVWKMEYDSERTESKFNTQGLHINKGLQGLANSDMEWLGNIPPSSLIEIRKQGAMDEIRSILGSGIDELINANPDNFHRSQDKIFDNINKSFAQHQQNIKKLTAKKWKFAGQDIGSWLVMGTLGVTAAATGMPVWGLAAIGADQLLDAPKLKEIPKSIRELSDENNKLKKSPVGLLFNISKKIT